MFSYFGCKEKLTELYPPPLCDRLFEPFAGSARYACRYFDRDVWLNDKFPAVRKIWEYLIQATVKDIRSLPEPKAGTDLRTLTQLEEPERLLLGMLIGFASAVAQHRVSDTCESNKHVQKFKGRFLPLAGRIGHWKVTGLDYSELPNVRATWYVDPPYQHQGGQYKFSNKKLDYAALGAWCLKRKGQLIVCEGTGADWMPFRKLSRPLKRLKRTDQYNELVYYRSDVKTGFGFY